MLYLYPNRPTLIPPDPDNPLNPKPDYINNLEKTGKYVCEQKWNGDNVLIYTSGLETNGIEIWNRHKKRHRYPMSPRVRDELSVFPKQSIINAELVHYKTDKIKDTIIVHSLLTWKSKILNGKTWGYARDILEDQEYGKHVRLSQTWESGFWKLFNEADGKVIEGIILKDPNGKIIISTVPINDVLYMYKIRKPSKKYSF